MNFTETRVSALALATPPANIHLTLSHSFCQSLTSLKTAALTLSPLNHL